MSLRIDTCAARHRGDRAEQQDRVGIFIHPRHPQLILAVLADGMGGFAGGALAAEQVLQHAREAFETHVPKRESARDMLTRLVESAHLAVRLSRFMNGQRPRSTIAALLWQPQRVDWVHCGDSRIYHYRGGQLVGRTEDHSVVAQLISEGRMSLAEAPQHPKRHVLHSSLGGDRMPQMSFSGIGGVHAGEHFLLCSDGLWTHVDEVEMGRILDRFPAREAAQRLIECARERAQGEGDNVSLAVLRCVEAGAGSAPGGAGKD